MNLLERAKAARTKPRKKLLKKDELELALAWVEDDITIGQVSEAFRCASGTAYVKLATILKAYFQGKAV